LDKLIKEQENELRHQIAYAERQFQWLSRHADLNIKMGNEVVARNYLEYMTQTNDFIDSARRKLEPGTRE
jgi:hypothetical protein